MKFLWSIVLAGLAAAVDVVPSLPVDKQVLTLTEAQMHDNVMKNFPPDWIVNSGNLQDYFEKNRDTNHTIYISDEKAFVSMATVKLPPPGLQAREGGPCVFPATYVKTYTKQNGQWYDAWKPASSCLQTGNSNSGGSAALSASTSISITESAGLDWKIIEDVLSASLSISVTQTWTETRTYTCNVQGNSVVQIWAQQYLAWGWFWSQKCNSNPQCGGCGDEYVNGGATAPAANPSNAQHVNFGCSTGWDKVQC